MAKTLAYYDTEIIMAVTRVLVLAHYYKVVGFKATVTSVLYYKSFTIIIYNHNDSGLYYKTMIQANLPIARSINYNH